MVLWALTEVIHVQHLAYSWLMLRGEYLVITVTVVVIVLTASCLPVLEITSPSSAPSQRAVCSPGWVVVCPWPQTPWGPPLDSQPAAATSSAPGKSTSLLPLDGRRLGESHTLKVVVHIFRFLQPRPGQAWPWTVWAMTLPLLSWATLGRSVIFSEPSFPHACNRKHNSVYCSKDLMQPSLKHGFPDDF